MIKDMIITIFTKNGLVMAFLIVGVVMYVASLIAKLTKGRIAGSAIAILLGLVLAYVGGG